MSAINAQQRPPGQFFISLHSGGYSFAKDIKKDAYGAGPKFEYGGMVGFPVGKLTHVYVKGSYFETRGDNIEIHSRYSVEDGEIRLTSRERVINGKSSFQQWRLNGGLQHQFFFPHDFYLLLNSGLTFVRTKDHVNPEDRDPYLDRREGWLGFFAGLGIEKRFQHSLFSVFAETQYNTTNDNFILWIGDFGGLSYSFGIRFYLPHVENRSR